MGMLDIGNFNITIEKKTMNPQIEKPYVKMEKNLN